MSGEKIQLLKLTMKYVITQLTEVDRLSIISFDDGVYPLAGLTLCSASGRAKLDHIAGSHRDMEAAGGTDIYSGLKMGVDVLEARKTKNPVTAVLLLTDGQDGSALPRIKEMKFAEGIVVHTFGFGKDHDAKVLSSVAEIARGTFTFIDTLNTVGPAFATVLGGLLSVVAQNIEVRIQPNTQLNPGHLVKKVHSHFSNSFNGSTAVIKLPDLFAEESRDLVFALQLPQLTQQLENTVTLVAKATVSYFDPQSKTTITLSDPVDFVLNRPQQVLTPQVANPQLDVQRNRLLCADAIQDAVNAADANDFTKSNKILQAAIETISNSVSKNDPMSKNFIVDLQECQRRCSDRSQFSQGGHAYAKSAQMSHQQQRAAWSAAPTNNMYANSVQVQQQAQVMDFFNM